MLAADVRPVPWTGKPATSVFTGIWRRLVAEIAAIVRWYGRAVCGLTGHEMVFHFEGNHVSLQCLSCGHESPGWTVGTKRAA